MKCGKIVVAVVVLSATALLCRVPRVQAQPSADQILSDLGWPADVKQKVLNGEFVKRDTEGVSDTDLSIGIAFLVKTSPDELSKKVMSGSLVHTDPQVKATGVITGAGSLADFSGLEITADVAKKLANAEAGESINLSKSEIAAFNALQGGTPQAIQQQLHKMLLARFQAYQSSGLKGIAPYDRGGGSTDAGADLLKASSSAHLLEKYMPAFYKVLTSYPQGTDPGMQQDFYWVKYDISGTTTFALFQRLGAADGDARAVVQRQYYVSTGYNAEQAVAGFLPVQEGTFVIYSNHTFTDQVKGFGGSMKRKIGRKMMADQLEDAFKGARQKAAQ